MKIKTVTVRRPTKDLGGQLVAKVNGQTVPIIPPAEGDFEVTVSIGSMFNAYSLADMAPEETALKVRIIFQADEPKED